MERELGYDTSFYEKSFANFETLDTSVQNQNTEHFTEAEIANEVCQLAGTRTFRKTVKMALKLENQSHIDKKTYSDLLGLPKKMYLNHTLVPALVNGLAYVAHVRPLCPIKTLAVFMLKNKNLYETDPEIEAEQRGSSSTAKSKSRFSAIASKTATTYLP